MKKILPGFLAAVLTSTLGIHATIQAQSQPASGLSEKQRMEKIRAHFEGAYAETTKGHTGKTPQRINSGDLEFRTIDGTSNNLLNPAWGSAGIALLRHSPATYSDKLSAPAGENRMSAREVSNLIAAQSVSRPNSRQLTSMVWQWGQFLDHDIDLTHAAEPEESFPIEVPFGDLFFDPFELGGQQIHLSRSAYEEKSGFDRPREQINSITAWIDGSNVYGSDSTTADSLRTFQSGLMKTSTGNLLPIDESGFFQTGDVRANEQNGLTAMHTLFVREHNRIANRIQKADPDASDQEIYLLARREVIGILQSITYNEFLPALLGQGALEEYSGYNPFVNPGIKNEFSTAAYRFGHSMLNAELLRLNNKGREIEAGHLALRDAFFNPQEVINVGIDPYLKGLVVQQAEEIDNRVIDDVRNFLFGPPGSGGFDLAALNIQRGRDHGLCDFNQMRASYGLEKVTEFSQICADESDQDALKRVCDKNLNDLDAWVGILAEDHAVGASVGPTLKAMLKHQFEAIRDGDRFWYERNFTGDELKRIRETRLSDVIKRNTGLVSIQGNAFFLPVKKRGRR